LDFSRRREGIWEKIMGGRLIAFSRANGRRKLSTENTNQKIDQLNELRRHARAWRIGATVASVAVSLIFLMILRSAAERLFQPGPARDEYLAELKIGLQTEVVPQVKTLAVHTVTELTPRVKAEVIRLRERTPELAGALTVELELFQKNLPARAEKVLRVTVEGTIRQREAKIRELYPDLTEQKVGDVVRLLLSEGDKRLSTIAARVSAPYEDVITQIVGDLNHIRDTEQVQVAGGDPAWELAQLCSNMLQDELQRKSPAEYQKFLTAVLAAEKK
jgi:hypothetical protein